MRIVSLLPSATEIVCGLGLRDQLVGVTHECDYPANVMGLPKVTTTLIPKDATSLQIDALVRERLKTEKALYSLNLAVLESVQPDLIVTQSLCDVCAVAESEVQAAVRSLPNRPKVINLEPACLDDVFECIRQVGAAAGCGENAEHYIATLLARVSTVTDRSKFVLHRPTVLLLEWIDPPFCSGHWNPELVSLAGGREVIGVAGKRSRMIEWASIVDADPEVLVIACCGFDVNRTLVDVETLRKQTGWNSLSCVQAKRVHVVDGSSYFNRPGPRLVDSLEILAHAIHPTIHALPEGVAEAEAIV
jgi:iron complex transport system substrate-binding protein